MINIEDKKREIEQDASMEYIDIDCLCDYSTSNNYICDIIMEIADYNVDIYNYDLFEWGKNNYDMIDEANNMLGTPTDIIGQLQQAEYYANEQDIYNNFKNVLLYHAYNLLDYEGIKEITEEQAQEIENFVEGVDNNDRLFTIEDIKEIINMEEGEEQ